jgi:hypothetical protein
MKPPAILIPSCDAYADLWPPFFAAFRRHWPDCPYRIYLGSNQLVWPDPGVTTLKSDAGLQWGRRLLDHLAQVQEEYVVLVLEDFFLRRPVRSARFGALMDRIMGESCDMLRLIARPGPLKNVSGDADYGPVDPKRPYSICTQAALWRVDFLRRILRADDSIWSFEMDAPMRVENWSGLYAVRRDILPYRGWFFHHVVEKGMWIPSEYFAARFRGLASTRSRPLMPSLMFAYYFAAESLERSAAGKLGKRVLLRALPSGLQNRGYRLRRTPAALVEKYNVWKK